MKIKMMFDDYDGNARRKKDSKIKVMVKLNKNSAICSKFIFNTGEIRNRAAVMKKIKEKLRLLDYEPEELRLFNSQGLELFEQDMRCISDKDILYVSRGEDFDSKTYISEYEKIKILGRGGFGSVILGIHKKDKTKVAIKITKGDLVDNTKDIDQVFAESETLKGLKHKNIVTIYNCFLIKKTMQTYFIMEYLEGGELLNYIAKKGVLTEPEALVIFKQLVCAIDYCHRMKIIHRDLKLENILRVSDTSDQFKIVDFGIAGLYSGKMSEQTNAGSLNYLPPEILTRSNIMASPALDVWGLGCILFAMVVGKIPFNGKTEKDTKRAIVHDDPLFPDTLNLSREVKDLINRMMDKNYENRLSIYGILHHPWVRGKKLENDKSQELGQIGEIVEEEDEGEEIEETIESNSRLKTKKFSKKKKVRRKGKKKSKVGGMKNKTFKSKNKKFKLREL